jgi:methionine-rich copper-binding protein CopC
MKRATALLSGVLGLSLLAFPALASAHAALDKAEPKVGSDVSKPPAEVKIWFTQHPEPAFSKIQVFGPDGKEVDKKDSHVDEKDKSLLIVSVEQLPPGTYKVHWDVVSLDTHRTRGDFKFTVK